MKKSLVIISLLLAGFALANASGGILDNRNAGADDLVITSDYACFKYSDNVDVAYTEFYYSLFRNQLSFQPDSVGYFAVLDMYVEIKSDSGRVVDSSSWKTANWIANLADAEIKNYVINDMIKAQLAPGNYTVTIKATDAYSGKAGESTMEIAVPHFSDTDMSMSNLELIYTVTDADGGNFDKAGRKIIPNTRGIYSHDDNVLYFYGEVYNLPEHHKNYTVDIRIYDINDNMYKELPAITDHEAVHSGVVLTGFNISAFKIGRYRLVTNVHSGGNSVSAEKYFEVTPGKYEYEAALEKEKLSDYPEAVEITTEKEAKKFRNQILYIASRDELRQYDDLPLPAKNNFAKAFWARRDPTPGTAINEFKIEHYERFKYVNDAYSTFSGPGAEPNGWRSDRGRVYITYGPPSDEENYPSSLGELPWIKWNYNEVEGGVYFIFVDESGYGNYRLIHSTAKGEPRDYNWEDRIRPSAAGSGN